MRVKSLASSAVLAIVLAAAGVACQGSDFAGGGKSTKTPALDGKPRKDGQPGGPDSDKDKDDKDKDKDKDGDKPGSGPGDDLGNPSDTDTDSDELTAEEQAQLEEEEGKVVTGVALSNTIALDGNVELCLDVETGIVTVRNTYPDYFQAHLKFVVTRKNGQTEEITINGDSSGQIPGWKKHCGAAPNMPVAVPFKKSGRNPTGLRPFVNGTKSCLEVIDGPDGRGGAVIIQGFDFGAKPC